MINMLNVEYDCVGCGACSNVCPVECIEMKANAYGFLFPNISKRDCINCHKCEKVCVAINDNTEIFETYEDTEYYAAWAKPEYMIENATSGGVVSLIIGNFFKIGKVYAACFSDNLQNLEHILCNENTLLKYISGSKYLQSNSSKVLKNIESNLNDREKVLYIGTPCQVASLKKYLKKEYNNLYTIDFFCHGVPSPLAWEKYKTFLERKYKSRLVDYNFRSKKRGWERMCVRAEFENKNEINQRSYENALHVWFGRHLSVRDSCFNCKFRKAERVSDLTVGDFWHIEDYYPEIPRDQGVSCVLINTANGKNLFNRLIEFDQINYEVVSSESIWEKRKTAKGNYKCPEERVLFLEDLANLSPEELVRTWPARSFISMFIEKLRLKLKL